MSRHEILWRAREAAARRAEYDGTRPKVVAIEKVEREGDSDAYTINVYGTEISMTCDHGCEAECAECELEEYMFKNLKTGEVMKDPEFGPEPYPEYEIIKKSKFTKTVKINIYYENELNQVKEITVYDESLPEVRKIMSEALERIANLMTS